MLKTALLLISFATMTAVAHAQPRIEVITGDEFPAINAEALAAQGFTVEIYDLDAPAKLEAELSAGLSADPKQAEIDARAYLKLLGEAELRQRVERAYQAQLRARELGIDRYPAVVFDDIAVIYGLTDLVEAMARYRQWRQRQDGARGQ